MDVPLPASPPAAHSDAPTFAPGDIYPAGPREIELCDRASRPDWLYLSGLLLLDAGSITYGSLSSIQDAGSLAVRFTAPIFVGLTWGASIGGGWLALPHCDAHFVGAAPREGDVSENWPLALSLALLAGATAPMINGILVGNQPLDWTTTERSFHVVAAGIAGVGGALLPYLLPPSSWAAARELRRIRVDAEARGGGSMTVSYRLSF